MWDNFNVTFNEKQSGFTLIELLVVLTIIGLIGGLSVPKFFKQYQQTQEREQLQGFVEQIEKLRIKAWESGQSVVLPEGGSDLWPTIPSGWQATQLPNLLLLSTGITNGGELILQANSGRIWTVTLSAFDGQTHLQFSNQAIP